MPLTQRALTAWFLFVASTASALEESASRDRPNVILVMTDDQGYGDFGVMGNPVLETPRLDTLARNSARMDRFYVCPVCSPTRAGLMTGRYHYRTRVVDTWVGRSMMDPDEVTVAELLQEAGYRTGIFGKWHLGDCHPLRPMDQGFDESLVHFGGGLAQPSEPPENQRRYTDPILVHNGTEVTTEGYCTDVYFDAALAFIDQCREQNQPFFVYLPTNAPHGPFHDVPEELRRKYVALGAKDQVARIYAMIENIDQNVGRLRDRLEEWDLAQNTLFLFLQDNGPNGQRHNAGLRGQKSHVYEGGIRSVFWAHWPERFDADTTSDRVAGYIDVMPTILEAAGAPVPDSLHLDGRSLLPLLEGSANADWPDRTLFLQVHRGNTPRSGHHFAAVGQRFKLVRSSGFGAPRPDRPDDAPWELYDLASDPGEQHDVAAQHAEEAQALRDAYEHWFQDVSSTRPDNYAPPRIVLGNGAPAFTRLSKQDWRVPDAGGWGDFGTWHLRVEGNHRFAATALLRQPVSGRLELAFGDQIVHQEFDQPAKELRLDGFSLAPGEVELVARIVTAEGETGVYQVLLERQDGKDVPPLGGCVIPIPDGAVPTDLRQHSGLVRDDKYPPFTKHVMVCGLLLLGGPDIEDRFLLDVAAVIEDMFQPDAPGIDRDRQDQVLRALYQRRTAIPFFAGDEPDLPDRESWQAFDRLNRRLSICDVIFQLEADERDQQPMEVLEHILHHLNMVGLHYVFPEDWGITRSSQLHTSMQEALEKDWYHVDYLDEFEDPDEAQRVLLQEYSYWVISSAWDLQRPFGGDHGGGEWTLADPAALRRAQPALFEMFQRTIPAVLVPPARGVMQQFRDAPQSLEQQIEALLPTAEDQAFREIPWHLNLMEARAAAAAQDRPIFLWIMNGHPFGCT